MLPEVLVRTDCPAAALRTAVPLAEPLEVRTLEAETLLTEVIDMPLPLVDVVAVPEALLTDDDEPAFLLTVEDATPIPFPLLLSVRPLLP